MKAPILVIITCIAGCMLHLPSVQAQSVQDIDPYSTKWELYVHGGMAYRIARISKDTPPDLKGYTRSMRRGYGASAGFARYIHRRFGPGLRYSRFGTNGKLHGVTVTDLQTGASHFGTLEEQVAIQIIAPTFNFRTASASSRFRLSLYIGLGYIDYQNNSNIASTPYKLSGGNLGTVAGANFGLALTPTLTLAAGTSLTAGVLNNFWVNSNGDKYRHTLLENERENLSHLQGTLGLHWNWARR